MEKNFLNITLESGNGNQEYYTAATDGSYYEEDFYATGLCYEDEEVELFRLCTDIYWF